jgi:hypothetical protein
MSECPFEELFGELHRLLNICLQVPRASLPVVGRIADTVGEEDDLFRIGGRAHQIRGVSTDHVQPVAQCFGEDVVSPETLAIGARDQPIVRQ